MDAREIIRIGRSAERTLVVPPERTVGHFRPGILMVYATPVMRRRFAGASG
jgi:fluoroacetyl-CoA thioesterase